MVGQAELLSGALSLAALGLYARAAQPRRARDDIHDLPKSTGVILVLYARVAQPRHARDELGVLRKCTGVLSERPQNRGVYCKGAPGHVVQAAGCIGNFPGDAWVPLYMPAA